MQRKGKADRLL